MTESQLYTLLNASNEEDVLRHFPSRYEDLNLTELTLPYTDNKRYVVSGIIKKLSTINRNRSSIIRFDLEVFGSKQVLPCLLVNQSFYLNIISNGAEKLLVLYYSSTRHCFIVSSIISIDSYYAKTHIKPVYSLPKGVSQSYFVNYLKKLISNPSNSSYIYSKVPSKYQKKYKLLGELDAFRIVHFPSSFEDLKVGLRVFKYEEALSYSLRALLIKKENEKKKKDTEPIDKNKLNQFVIKLPYKLTNCQKNSVREIVLDLEKNTVMYRLLQGDVGSGKTLVCFISLYANYLRNKQGVLLSPTYELSLQHYNNALDVFKNTDIKIALLAGNIKASVKKKIIEDLKDKKIDILIATHAALSKDVEFDDLGLTIIDEQQLFGVKQREMIVNKSTTSDLLMMSATPIPRTLSQIINADLEVSTLDEFPFKTRNVKSKVCRSNDPIIDDAIKKCLSKDRQIFVVVPKIDENDKDTKSTEEIYKEYVLKYGEDNVSCLNGRIKKEEREKIFLDFVSGKKKILVSTTVIEVGVDVKTAGLLVVYNANYFGLSSLHQLRGRIGRSGSFAMSLFLYDGDDLKAKDKLNFLADNNDGMKVSEYDLKMRGTGSYEGEKQSGKSELSVCNFVSDYNVFFCAKKDAEEILGDSLEKENHAYLEWLDLNKKTLIV